MVNREVLNKFSAELRSGKYQQIRGNYFGEGNERCALGVGISLFGIPHNEEENFWETFRIWLLANVKEGLGGEIIRMNDSGKSFEEIADFIDSYEEEE